MKRIALVVFLAAGCFEQPPPICPPDQRRCCLYTTIWGSGCSAWSCENSHERCMWRQGALRRDGGQPDSAVVETIACAEESR